MPETSSFLSEFPSQKKSFDKKGEQWIKDCIDAAENTVLFNDASLRKSYKSKKINYDLVNNILHQDDVNKISDPFGLQADSFAAKMQNYPIMLPRINVLVGEELNRKFDWRVRVGNDNAISDKEEEIMGRIRSLAERAVQSQNFDEEKLKKELKELNKWKNYEYQDIREITGNNILKYFWQTLDLKRKFNRGVEDLIIGSEEIYAIDIVGKNPVVEKLNPLHVHTIGQSDSIHVEDSDIIVIENYKSVGQTIDKYYEYLKDEDVKRLEEGSAQDSNNFLSIGKRESSILMDSTFESNYNEINDKITIDERGRVLDREGFDLYGNVRVVRVLWKSRRKLKEIKYFDKLGNEQLRHEDEKYEPIKDIGESEVGHIWVNEWWEGVKIADDIYIKAGPKKVQMQDMDDPSKCHPGIVGTLFNINGNKAQSLVDIMKPYQYLYNTFMYRTELAMAKSHGKLLKLDFSLIPDNMELDEWFHYAVNMGMIIEDPFTESNKVRGGEANLAQLSRGASSIDLEMSQYINQHLGMMDYVDNQCGRVVGINSQREGSIENRETVGGVERAVVQSNHITEKIYSIHDNVKKRVLEALLETAKYCWKDLESKKLQYVLDDLSTKIINVDVEMFRESNYDIHITNSSNDAQLLQSLKQLAHAAIQNDNMQIKDLVSIYMSDSISDIRRKLEASDEENKEREKEEKAHEQEMLDKQIKERERKDMRDKAHELLKQDKENEGKVTLEDIKAGHKRLEEILKAQETKEKEMSLQDDKQSHETKENEKDRKIEKLKINKSNSNSKS